MAATSNKRNSRRLNKSAGNTHNNGVTKDLSSSFKKATPAKRVAGARRRANQRPPAERLRRSLRLAGRPAGRAGLVAAPVPDPTTYSSETSDGEQGSQWFSLTGFLQSRASASPAQAVAATAIGLARYPVLPAASGSPASAAAVNYTGLSSATNVPNSPDMDVNAVDEDTPLVADSPATASLPPPPRTENAESAGSGSPTGIRTTPFSPMSAATPAATTPPPLSPAASSVTPDHSPSDLAGLAAANTTVEPGDEDVFLPDAGIPALSAATPATPATPSPAAAGTNSVRDTPPPISPVNSLVSAPDRSPSHNASTNNTPAPGAIPPATPSPKIASGGGLPLFTPPAAANTTAPIPPPSAAFLAVRAAATSASSTNVFNTWDHYFHTPLNILNFGGPTPLPPTLTAPPAPVVSRYHATVSSIRDEMDVKLAKRRLLVDGPTRNPFDVSFFNRQGEDIGREVVRDNLPYEFKKNEDGNWVAVHVGDVLAEHGCKPADRGGKRRREDDQDEDGESGFTAAKRPRVC